MHDQATIPRHAVIAPPAERGALSAETAALSGNLLVRQNSYAVYLATARQIPHLLQEIGRQREIAFRAVGEGTGRALDLDRFDQHYLHLFVWDHQQEQLAGAYRITPTLTVLAEHGPEGLYTTTLLEFSQEFPAALTPGLELGRSFVVPAYQRSPLPLALLWRGTGVWLRQHPQCVRLFGAVSISGDYSVLSRGLLVEFLSRRPAAGSLPGGIRPRHPPGPALTVPTGPEAWAGPAGLKDISVRISLLEGGKRGVPELLKHYGLRLNARLLSFNVDPDFSHCLDALLPVDLREIPPAFLKRFFGADFRIS